MNLLVNNQTKLDKISFELNDELKEIIYKELKEQNDNDIPSHISHVSRYGLSYRTEYSIYHITLDRYFKKKQLKNPSETDYLAWILLLTYPENKIRSFKNINDLNIHFKSDNLNKTDFEIIEVTKKTEDDMDTIYTCICSHPIENIYKLRNKFSDITIQVGCECIKRYGLVSKSEITQCKKKMCELKERNKEIEEGKPIGYYKELRENEKLIKNQNKLEKEKLKQKKLDEKIKKQEEKLRLNEEKLMAIEDNAIKKFMFVNHYKKCLLCKQEGLYSKYSMLTICNKCISSSNKNKKIIINNLILKNKREYKEDNCLNCDTKFIYRYKGREICFCKICEKSYKKMKCDICPNEYIDDINSLDILCNVCDEKSKKCLDCNNKFISEDVNIIRCNLCEYKFTNKKTFIKCIDCNEDVEIKKCHESWREYCNVCFKYNLHKVKCITCNETFERLYNQTWRKKCSDCYHKSK
jgi:hypothetical protein